jgi:DNA-binding SARP family transcriptional activator/DNA-binding XRE family transcriptional regulator
VVTRVEGEVGRHAGDVVRERRREAGLTQGELADLAGVSVGMIRDLEQGRIARPRASSAAALARALGLDAERAGELTSAVPRRRPDNLQLSILGPVSAVLNGRVVDLGSQSRRAVLVLLALGHGQLVHRASLIDALWAADPPPTAATMIQAHVGALRRLLDPGRGHRDEDGLLISAGTSYRLRANSAQLDLLTFREQARAAAGARSAGDLAAACDLYEQALGLCHGELVSDVDVLRDHPAVVGLRREWASVVTAYGETAFSAGLQQRALPWLLSLVQLEPLNEKAHALLMMTLAGTGQQAAALEVFDDLRHRLDEQLGVRPCPEVLEAHQRVLRQQIPVSAKSASGRPAATSPASSMPEVPRQLPPATPHFTGRAAELNALMSQLGHMGRFSGAVVISAISGTAGIGKTTLAVHWAHQVAEQFPDGQLYANLRGFGPADPARPAGVLRGFLDTLGVPAAQIPGDVDDLKAMYRRLLEHRRVLILLDNARDAAQVRPLLPASCTVLVLVTSRNDLADLAVTEGAGQVSLDVLTDAEARALLASHLGTARLTDEPQAADELIQLCARLPLALSVTAARAAARPRFALAALAAELRDARSRLDSLSTGHADTDVRAVFSWSYQNLRPATARMFRLLSIHPGPDITAPAAASLAAAPLPQTLGELRELTRCHLLGEPAPGRYVLHDLLRAYASEQAAALEPEAERRAAICRTVDHYLHTAHAASQKLDPHRDTVVLRAPQSAVRPERIDDQVQALAWFTAEHHVLLSAVRQAGETGLDVQAWQLPWALYAFLERQGHWRELAAVQYVALEAANRIGDHAPKARAHQYIARAHYWMGSCSTAHSHLARALDLFQDLDDLINQARIHLDLGRVLHRMNRTREAVRSTLVGLSVFEKAGYRRGRARALNNLGWYYAHLGEYEQALACSQEALSLDRESGDRSDAAFLWDTLGYAHHHLGDYAQAASCYLESSQRSGENGDRVLQAKALAHLATTYNAAGRLNAARDALQQAKTVLGDLHEPHFDEVCAALRHLGTAPVP